MDGKTGKFFGEARYQNNPLSALTLFLEQEKRFETAQEINKMRFVGYVLDIGYDTTTIITSDPFKRAVGGIPRGCFLIMAPDNLEGLPPHFTLLRVNDTAPTPLSAQVQQTYFELHKKSMPELDIWTQSELQWGALKCAVLGMFYPDPNDSSKISFSGDVNNVVSAHRYKVYAPDAALLALIVNGTVKLENRAEIGKLRPTECQLPFQTGPRPLPIMDTPVFVSINDFKGCRTAMFGKTRLGKSNVVKLIAQGVLDATKGSNSVGQLIFDINGEYANDNPQDGNKSIRSANEDRCVVYALTPRPNTPSSPLRLNFYEQPDSCIEILASLLEQDNKTSNYIRSFASVKLPSIESIAALPDAEKVRPVRKIQMYWAILKEAGFDANERRLTEKSLGAGRTKDFNPHFNNTLRTNAYRTVRNMSPPDHPENLDELVGELKVIGRFARENPNDQSLISPGSRTSIFDADDRALLEFLAPASGSGPMVLRAYQAYHSPNAGDFINEILRALDAGKTVILDLGNATDLIRRYFSDMLSRAVFSHQEEKFVANTLGQHFIQLYFEEAHNLFPLDDRTITGVYARFAKEGAKFHIGIVYSTQSPSTINKELLVQTENFFVGHLSSSDETRALTRLQIAFTGLEDDIMRSRTPGYMRMLTLSHRFVVPVQAHRFEAKVSDENMPRGE